MHFVRHGVSRQRSVRKTHDGAGVMKHVFFFLYAEFKGFGSDLAV